MDARRLASLIDLHSPALVLFARTWCDTPEDAVQDAFCKLATQRTWPDDPVAWLFQVVRNRAMDLGKAQRRRARREAAVARPVRWFVETEVNGVDAEAAARAMESLPTEQRELIVLRLWSNLTLEQAAATVGCSVSTAHRRFEAGIAALRELLGEPQHVKP